MTTDKLLKQQEELQKEGKKVLDQLGIIKILSKYGNPQIVGSFETGLMVWRDIDIELVKEIDDKDYWKAVDELFYDNSKLKYLTLINFKNSKNPMTPKGFYIGIKCWLENKEWKIDVWFIPPRLKGSENMNEWVKNRLTDENKKIILQIRNQIHKSQKYRKEIFSTDVYRAVIENRVNNLEGFKEYLKKQGKSL